MHGGWPFVGRASEVAEIQRAVAAGPGVALTGDAGVGKTRLAAEVATAWEADGLHAVRITGTEAATRPFGAFAHELPRHLPNADGSTNVLRLAAERLRQRYPADLLLVVDDAHLLDRQSAALLHYLVRQGLARVVLTVRSGRSAPEAVTDLWRSGRLSTLDIKPLDQETTGALLRAVLGAEVSGDTVRQLWEASRGNLLYLRELVASGMAGGALSIVDECWRWAGELAVSATLRDLVRERIGQLTRAEREALELVALGEPIGIDILLAITSTAAASRLEDRGLITVSLTGRRRQASMAHPLYREVVRRACGVVGSRARLRALADAVAATGARRRDDVLRVAVWRLDSGSADQPGPLLAAARIAWSSYDIELAARLFRAALAAGAGLPAAAALAFNLFHLGRSEEAVPVLEAVADQANTDQERADYLLAFAVNLSCGLGRYDDARRVLREYGSGVIDPAWRQEVLTTQAVVDFFAARPVSALQVLDQAHALGPMTARTGAEAGAIETWCHAFRGRTRRSLAMATSILDRQESWRDYAGYVRPTLMDARCNAHLFAGELDEAEAAAATGLEVAAHSRGWDMALAGYTAYRAQALRMRGDAATALRLCRDAVRRSAWNTNVPRCLSELAHAAALLGDLPRAQSAIDEAQRRLHPGIANWGLAVAANAPWVLVARGDVAGATRALSETAEQAIDCELYGYALLALHDVVRLSPVGRSRTAADRLAQLESVVDGRLVSLAVAHARAAAAMDGPGLLVVSRSFADAGMLLYAAEAAAQAAAVIGRGGRDGRPGPAHLRAEALARRCPGVRTPALRRLTMSGLTPRQWHVVHGVAAGRTCRQIADELGLSVRTVENHLSAAYERLGVHDRESLAAVLNGDSTALERPIERA